jgi:hypothetical protein
LLARNGPVDGVDQRLGLDEFDPCPLGLVAIEGRREDFCKSVAVIGHPLARLFQRFKSLAHLGFAFCWHRVLIGAEGIAAIVFLWPRRARAQYANGHRESCGISILPLSEFQENRREAIRARDNVCAGPG